MLAIYWFYATTENLIKNSKNCVNEVDVYMDSIAYSLAVLWMTRKDQRKEQMCLS